MDEFPFTEAEWAPIKEVSLSILNASYAEDEALGASLHLDMFDLLDGLRATHGDHPVLLETMADYSDDDAKRSALYRRATALAEEHGLPTLSIRLSFARMLVIGDDATTALDELRACGGEVAGADAGDRAEWTSLLSEAANNSGRIELYRQAAAIAAAFGQPALYIRLLLVRFLLDTGDTAAAREELRSCEGEVAADADEQTWWAELLAEAGAAA